MWNSLADSEVLVLVGTATGGGLWFVVRLIYRFQRDFTDRYAAEIASLQARVAVLELDKQALNKRLIACATERGALRAVVRQNGIEWDPADWGALTDDT